MEIERFRLGLRHRSAFEAADLGLAVARCWRGPVYRAWLATFVPFTLLLFLVSWQQPIIGGILGWWLKPLFDRILLKIYAEAVFDAPPGVRAVWRALPGLIRNSGLLWSLTLGRFDMARSFHLPIRQLEGQRGPAARARQTILGRRTRGCAVWLTFVCTHFSVFMQLSVILLLELLRPAEAPEVFDLQSLLLGRTGQVEALLSHVSWVIGESLVEPFYVAAGFTLYLNRRNDLEGWGIEQSFRRLALRVEAERPPAAGRRTAQLAVLALCGLLLQLPANVHSETMAGAAASPNQANTTDAEPHAAKTVETGPGEAKRRIAAVLADPVFGHKVPDWTWQSRDIEDEEPEDGESRIREALLKLARWIAEGIRTMGYVGAVLLVLALIVLLYRQRASLGWRTRPRTARPLPASLFGLDIRPDSLPEDVALAASRELAAGRPALALSLLYRGALAALVHGAGVDFRPGDTESDCRARVLGHVDGDSEGYFAELLDAWRLVAYAGTVPAMDKLRDLCSRWPRHFGIPGGQAGVPCRTSPPGHRNNP